jgi:hypothetical protein
MKRYLLIPLFLVIAGCSTIINGPTQTVSVNSNVQGADVSIDGIVVGKTPYTGLVKKPNGSGGSVVTVSKPGYDPKSVTLDAGIEGAFWGNIIVGGGIGSTTDYASHSMYKYANGTINVDLVKSEGK